MHFVSL